jgi:transposase
MNSKTHIETEPVDELTKIINSLLSKEQGYQSEIAILKEQIRSLQDRLFGRKSEKRVVDDASSPFLNLLKNFLCRLLA